jgi:TPR repeat protein
VKQATLLAVLTGAGVGIAAAMVERGATESDPPALPPAAARPVAEATVAPARAATPAVSAPASSSPASEPFPPTEPAIASPDEFQAAAIACDEKDAGACRRAALAADLGSVVPKDPERARTFRKVELTIVVRACEKGAVDACLTLADRYLRGDGLEQNDRTATALIAHARELCARRPEDACRNVPAAD